MAETDRPARCALMAKNAARKRQPRYANTWQSRLGSAVLSGYRQGSPAKRRPLGTRRQREWRSDQQRLVVRNEWSRRGRVPGERPDRAIISSRLLATLRLRWRQENQQIVGPANRVRRRGNEWSAGVIRAGATALAFVPAVGAITRRRARIHEGAGTAQGRQAGEPPNQPGQRECPNHGFIIVEPLRGINRAACMHQVTTPER